MKNIYLEPNEEIISVVDRLVQAKDEALNLVVPSNAQIWQSSINLKLLKREADNLNKTVTFIVADDLGAEMAERIGFAVKREKDFPVELVPEEEEIIQEDEAVEEAEAGQKIGIEVKKEETVKEAQEVGQNKDNMIDILVDELESEKASKKSLAIFSSWRKKPSREPKNNIQKSSPPKRMADIVTPSAESRPGFFQRSIKKKEPLIRKLPKRKPKPSIEEPLPKRKIYTEIEKSAGLRWSKLFIVFIVIALIMAGFVAFMVLPNAEITISPKKEKITFDLSVIGSKDISQVDQTLNQIPIQEVEITKAKSREFKTTGEKDISEKARGYITIYNEYSSSPQTLVATTRFESADDKIFRIPKSITIPGAKIEEGKIIASSLKVEVVADEPGEDYNIGSSNFTIPGFKGTPKFAGFYGESSDSMSGGYVGKAKIALAKDLEDAEKALVEELKDEMRRALNEQIPSDLRIIEDGIKEELTKISFDVEEGEQAEKFTLEVKASIRALFFKEEDLKNLVNLNLISQISEDKVPVSETQAIRWDKPDIDWSKREVSFSLNIEEDIAWRIDIESLKQNLAGQDEVEVRRYLANQPEIEKARVSFWPFWVKKIPGQEKKIKVNIEL